MRTGGASIKQIAAALGVSTSSASVWTRDIALSDEHRRALDAADPVRSGSRAGQRSQSAAARRARLAAQDHGRALAKAGDPLHHQGCMLFWAEGSRNRNTVTFTNSDVGMVRHFARFLVECYEVDRGALTLRVNCYLENGLALAEIEAWWLDEIALPPSSLRRSIVNRASAASQRKRQTLPYGTARLQLCSTFVVQSIYGAIQEYAGIERPEWLG